VANPSTNSIAKLGFSSIRLTAHLQMKHLKETATSLDLETLGLLGSIMRTE
jgi:hypothetical protein